MLHLRPLELHQNDRLLRTQKIRHHANYFQVEFLYLVAGKNRVGVALHPRLHLIDRERFIRSSWNLRKRAIATEQQARENQARENQD